MCQRGISLYLYVVSVVPTAKLGIKIRLQLPFISWPKDLVRSLGKEPFDAQKGITFCAPKGYLKCMLISLTRSNRSVLDISMALIVALLVKNNKVQSA